MRISSLSVCKRVRASSASIPRPIQNRWRTSPPGARRTGGKQAIAASISFLSFFLLTWNMLELEREASIGDDLADGLVEFHAFPSDTIFPSDANSCGQPIELGSILR